MGPGIANDLFVGNIHRFCSQFLFEENIIAKNTSIIDEKESILIVHNLLHYDTSIDLTNEQTEYIKDIIKIQHILIQIENGIKYNNFIHNDIITKYHLEEFVNIYKNWTDWLFFGFLSKLPEEKLKLEKAKKFGVSLNVLSIIEKAIHYNLYKENFSLLDFDDLLVLTYNYAFHNINSTKKYKWIQIDEVQDLSPFQFSIIDLFTEKTDNSTIIYLGDEQQAIYSFIGAKLSTLNSLKNRCLSHIHYLHTNYRSPKYLLDVFNSYANKELNVDLSLLPKSVNYKKADNYSLVISSGENKDNEALLAARTAYQLNKKNPNERTAILVPWNKDADLISNILQKYKINHFKISGEDLFSKPQVQLLLAHLQVVYSYDNYQAWAKIFYLTGIFNSITSSRKCIKNWRDNYILPSDLFDYTKSSYLLELNKHIQGKYIVFDTETTGLNVSEDDIVQIAALKIENDKIIERFNILLETDKNIPPMLKDKPNPLIEVYKNSTKHKRKYGLHSFLDFIENLPLIGHNVEYDYNILNHNLIRDCGIYNFKDEHAVYFDTLKIAKIIAPNAPKYTLEHLLKTFDVLGENSHLAEDDVIATKSILDHCVKEFKKIRNNHINYLENNYSIFSDFKNKYNPIYKRTKGMLNNISSSTSPILVEELKRIYADFLELNWIQEEYKIDYFFNFLEKDIIKQEKTPTLLEQLDTHLLDIITLKESDICDGKSLKEKIFISTVHKAKGLEFENIIIFEATEGVYPLFSETKIEKKEESARLFYVAMTRAKKRLLILHCDSISGISKKGNYYCFDKSPTIFLRSISHYFERLESDELSSILT